MQRKKTSAIDEEREQQHNGAKAPSQEDAAEQEKNPSITNPHWRNANGEPITKALVGDEVYLCANVQDIDEGASAKIKIVEKDANGQDDDVATLTATVSGGRIECAWKVVYTEDDDDSNSEQETTEKGYTLPEYAFTVECGGVVSKESGRLDVRGWVNVKFNDNDYKLLKDCRFYIYSDNWESDDVKFKDDVLNFSELPFLTNKKWNLGVRF